MYRLLLTFPAVTLLVMGCKPEGLPSPQPVPPQFDSVIMHRSPCFGVCPVYTVQVFADGRVSFHGEDEVAAKGERNTRIPASDVSALELAIEQTGFRSMKENYMFASDGCTAWSTDNPTVTIIQVQGSVKKRVAYYYGCAIAIGEQIDSLSKTIDQVSRDAAWIGPRPF